MATPENTLITRAEVTSISVPATGRKALVLDGTTIELGDTGWRDLSGSLSPMVTAGRVLARRHQGTVSWLFINIILASTATVAQSLFSATPGLVEPFLPDQHTYEAVKSNATVEGRFAVLSGGSPRLDYATPGAGYNGKLSFTVRGSGSWPSTLPGVADGQPVNV